MIQSRTTGCYNAIFLASCVVATVTFWLLWIVINLTVHGSTEFRVDVYFRYNLLILIGLCIERLRSSSDRLVLISRDIFRAARHGLRQAAYVGAVLGLTLLLLQDLNISRTFLFALIPVTALAMAAANALLPSMLSGFFFEGRHQIKVAFIGPSKRVKRMSRWTSQMSRFGFRIVGLLSDDTDRKSVYRIPVLGKSTDLERIITEHGVKLVMLLEVPNLRDELRDIMDQAERRGARVITVNTLSEKYQHSLQYIHHYGLDFITVRTEPLQDPLVRIIKRAVDVLVSLPVVIFVIPPLAAVVSIMQRIQSPGPLFFRQWRAGISNQPFAIMKFRTMSCANDDPTRQAAVNDSRIFPFGRFLRRVSLDEFPQFINVLRGDMSVIGPRPHMLEHNEQFEKILQSYHVRSLVKPGITGLAQIRGYRGEARTDDDIRSRVECDIEYIEQYSLLLDSYIAIRTAQQVLFPPKSAY